MSSLSSTKRNDKWNIECPGHFFWTPSIRRLYASLTQELNPEFFELLELKTLNYQLAEWRDYSSWILDRVTKALETDGFSYTLRFRGVRVGANEIQLNGYFEVNEHSAQFCQFRATIEQLFREYGCSVTLGQFSIPIARFKNKFSYQHVPNLDRWEECEFGELRFSQWIVQKDGRTYGKIPLQRFIAHRGNEKGRSLTDENKPERIDELNQKGIACEIDVWYKESQWWLGHDAPETQISFEWLLKYLPLRLIHCKNHEALDTLHRECGKQGYEVNLFYHTTEDYALTSRGHIIVHPDKPCFGDSIEMMPELSTQRQGRSNVVCSDSRRNLH